MKNREIAKIIAKEFGRKEVNQLSVELQVKKSYIHYVANRLRKAGWRFPHITKDPYKELVKELRREKVEEKKYN
jgi:hypothetical protein|tara:strand:+ start:3667 stop:3888 length:222 start_codon:yes stop_codon:yes gene_type:complete